MPNARIHNEKANVGIRSSTPNVRVSSHNTGRSGDAHIAFAGSPIGLLLALTYSSNIPVQLPSFGDMRPNVRIRAV